MFSWFALLLAHVAFCECVCRYLLFAADPYETIAFKIPNREIERDTSETTRGHFYTNWDTEQHTFVLELTFKPLPKPSPAATDQINADDDDGEHQQDDGDNDATMTDNPRP